MKILEVNDLRVSFPILGGVFARKVAEAAIKECRQSLVAAYEDAGRSGLCAERRWEMALDSLRSINLSQIIS